MSKLLTINNKQNDIKLHIHASSSALEVLDALSQWCGTVHILTLLHCSTKGQDQSVVVPRVPASDKMIHLHKGSHKFFRVSRDVTLFVPFYHVPLARCWIDTPVSVGAEHRSLPQSACPQGGKEKEKRAICLEQHSPSCTKKCWDREGMRWSV